MNSTHFNEHEPNIKQIVILFYLSTNKKKNMVFDKLIIKKC